MRTGFSCWDPWCAATAAAKSRKLRGEGRGIPEMSAASVAEGLFRGRHVVEPGLLESNGFALLFHPCFECVLIGVGVGFGVLVTIRRRLLGRLHDVVQCGGVVRISHGCSLPGRRFVKNHRYRCRAPERTTGSGSGNGIG